VKNRPGDYVIGVDSDQDGILPGKILTSMVKRVDIGVYRVAEEAYSHKPRSGQLVLGLKEGGVGLTDFQYTRTVVTPAKIAAINRLKAAIIAGTIKVPSTREELASFKRVPL
jgi:basic membrane protein A